MTSPVSVRAWFAIALLAGVSLRWDLAAGFHAAGRWPGAHYVDEVTAFERRFDAIRAEAQRYRVLGHHLDLPADPSPEILARNGWRSHLAQYTLTPAVVDLYKNPHPVVLENTLGGPPRLVPAR